MGFSVNSFEGVCNLANMACEIAEVAGTPLISQGYYSDHVFRYEYAFDKLKIFYSTPERAAKRVSIVFAEVEVLSFDFEAGIREFINGRWIELVNEIYNQVPNFQREKELKEEYRKQKIAGLRALEEYVKSFVKYNQNNNGTCHYLKSKLELCGITFSHITEKKLQLANNSTYGSDYYYDFKYYVIYDHGVPVLKFKDSEFDVYNNLYDYIKSYSPGSWESAFKFAIDAAKIEERNINQIKVDSSVDSSIEAFRRSLNKWKY